jgi:hypothetical protein
MHVQLIEKPKFISTEAVQTKTIKIIGSEMYLSKWEKKEGTGKVKSPDFTSKYNKRGWKKKR